MARRSALDAAFPSLVLLGAGLVAAFGLLALLGWKIFALEAEQEEIGRERLLLERDRDAFLTYGGELPQMTERHRRLTVEANELEGRNKALSETAARLEEQCGELERKAGRLTGAVAELEARVQELETNAASERARLEKLRPEQEEARREVALLKAQEAELSKAIAGQQKHEASLTATLEGLERSIAHNRDLLARMTADHEAYTAFERNLEAISRKFEGLLERTGGHVAEYGTRLEGMEKFLARMDHSLTLIDSERQTLGQNLDAIKKDRASWATLLKQNGEQNRSLQAQVEAITATSRKFQSAMESVAGMDRRLQTALAAETASLRKMAQEDSQTRANLNQAAQSLAQTGEGLKKGLEQVRESGIQIADLLTAQKEEIRGLSGSAGDLVAAVRLMDGLAKSGSEAGARLMHAADALSSQAQALTLRLQEEAARSGRLDDTLATQGERIRELAALASSLSGEIDENRRRGGRLEVLLGEIQALLDKKPAAEQPQ